MRERKFSHNGRTLVVKAIQENEGWKIKVFENDNVVTPVSYHVSYDTEIAAKLGTTGTVPVDLVEKLMDIAQSDIKNGVVSIY